MSLHSFKKYSLRIEKGKEMFKRILACYDLSPCSQEALEWALKLGEQFHSSLKVAHAFPLNGSSSTPALLESSNQLAEYIREQIDQDLRRLSTLEAPSLRELEIEILQGRTIPAILQEIQQNTPDLVILGTHGRTGFERVILGSVAEKIVRHSPAPVWIARNRAHWPLQRILIPIDFSEFGEETLQLAQALTQKTSTAVDLVHVISLAEVVHYPSSITDRAFSMDPKFFENLEKRARENLQKMIDSSSLSLNPHVLTGSPGAEICRLAQELKADLVLIPTHGRSGIRHLLIGSVAEQVIRYASCSVFSFSPRKMIPHKKEVIAAMAENKG